MKIAGMTTIFASVALFAAVALATDAAALPWALVARSGQEAPGLWVPANFTEFTLASKLGPGGRVVFGIPAPGSLPPGQAGVYGWTSAGGLSLLAAYSTTPDAEFASATRVVQGDDGDVALLAELRPKPVPLCGQGIPLVGPPVLYGRVGTALARVALWNDPAPGAPEGWVFHDFADAILGASHSIFYAGTSPDACSEGADPTLFRFDEAGTTTLVVRHGMEAPGAVAGTTIDQVLPGAAIADDGTVAVLASLSTLTAFTPHAIYGFDADAVLAPLVMTGSPTVMAGGASFEALGAPVSNGAGDLAFYAILDDALIDFPDPSLRGLWVPDGAGSVVELFRAGDAVPGAPAGAVFADLRPFIPSILDPEGLRINASGEVAFVQSIEVAPELYERGIFGPDGSGAVALRMQTGDPAPSIAGATVSSLALLGFSDDRRIAVAADLNGPTVDASNDRALYLLDPSGVATLLHRNGDLFEFGASQMRPTYLRVASFDRGLSHVAVELGSNDGREAVFISPLPEPSASMLATTVWASLLTRWFLHKRSS